MKKSEMFNKLAMAVLNGEESFSELYKKAEPEFTIIIENYLMRNNLFGFTFDISDYMSATGQALWESLEGYDSNKGDFMPRFVLFARMRMKEVTDYNLASKRFDKSKQSVSYEQLFEAEEFDLEDVNAEFSDTKNLLKEFIQKDKDGKVIEILLSTTNRKLRHSAFTKLFGKYEATERKKVQRAKERLQVHLTSNGVFI
ncbi:hypothetical protein SDC9_96852 [bioreactor metagenome]|uniref:Uncharacterized protein n=1 Tax=bioreactor metagenome TaxID=1076179 RepID=A0A645AAT4_9ZZZZ